MFKTYEVWVGDVELISQLEFEEAMAIVRDLQDVLSNIYIREVTNELYRADVTRTLQKELQQTG